MKPDLLRQFNNDYYLRDEVKNFIYSFIDQEALKRLYGKEDVASVAEARQLIDNAFSELDNLYGIRNKTTKSVSQAK